MLDLLALRGEHRNTDYSLQPPLPQIMHRLMGAKESNMSGVQEIFERKCSVIIKCAKNRLSSIKSIK